MKSNNLKQKIKIAKEAVENESEPYKTEAFKIILNKLIESNFISKEKESFHLQQPEKTKQNIDLSLKKFASQCNLTEEQLGKVFSIKGNSINIIAPIQGSDAKKHLYVTLCVLTAYEYILEHDWVPVSVITEYMKSAGVKDLKNLSRTLAKHPTYFRKTGGKRFAKYKLTTADGRITALEIIRKLAKGDSLNEN